MGLTLARPVYTIGRMKRSPQPKRKKPLQRESSRRRAQRAARQQAGAAAVQASGACQLYRLGGCGGGLVPHELVKQSALRDARLVERNVVAVCWFHNSWIEDHPYDAQHYGVCIPRWVYDMHGEAAFDEADRLRALVTFGQMGEPFWIAEAEQAPDGYSPRA